MDMVGDLSLDFQPPTYRFADSTHIRSILLTITLEMPSRTSLEPRRFESLIMTIEYLCEEAIRLRLDQTAAALQRSIECMRAEFFAQAEMHGMQALPLVSEAAAKAAETTEARAMFERLSRMLAYARTSAHRPRAVGRYAGSEYRRTLLHAALAPLTRTELDIMIRVAFATAEIDSGLLRRGEFPLQVEMPLGFHSDIDAQVPIGYGSD